MNEKKKSTITMNMVLSKKYKLAKRRNCSNKLIGKNVSIVYFTRRENKKLQKINNNLLK